MEVYSLSTNKIINQKAFANNSGIPMGINVNLRPSSEADIPSEAREPLSCFSCGAVINPYSRLELSTGKWKCNICNSVNVVDDLADHQESVGLESKIVDYLTMSEHAIPDRTSSVVFIVDTTFSQEDLKSITSALKQVVGKMNDDVSVGLIFVDSCVSVVNLKGKTGMVNVHCLPGHTVNMPPTLRTPTGGFQSCLRSLDSSSRDAFILALETITSVRKEKRCLGTAVHEALMLFREIQFEQSRKQRIVLFTSGLPTHGPGSVPFAYMDNGKQFQEEKRNSIDFFRRLGEVASGMSVVVDVYGLAGLPATAIPLLQNLTRQTKGKLILQSLIHSKLLAKSITESLTSSFGTHGIIDVRMSPGLRLSTVAGHVSEKLTSGESGRRLFSGNACLVQTMEFGKSITFFLEATSDFGSSDLYLQVILSWKTHDGHTIERVMNISMTPTGNLMEFLKAINPINTAVLLAKKLILETIGLTGKQKLNRMKEIRIRLPYDLAYMSQKFGKLLENREGGFFGYRVQQTWACPQELWYISQSLYHLYRGLLLDGIHKQIDEVEYLQKCFVSGTQQLSDRILVPRMYLIQQDNLMEFIEIPAITSILAPEQAVLLDHGFHIFVWIGNVLKQKTSSQKESLLDKILEKCENYTLEKCAEREFLPELRIVYEGDSKAELFYDHLIPTDKDSIIDQASQYYGVQKTESSKTVALPNSNLSSFYEWCRKVNVEPAKLDRETLLHVASL